MSRMFDELAKNTGGKIEPGKPYVYGFSMSVGPDGKPRIQEFGNTGAAVQSGGGIGEEREPLTDVIERGEDITVIAEIPGVEKEDIKLKATKDILKVDVETEKRKYHKQLKLPSEVKPDVSRATYKNGILEVKLTKIKKEKKDDEGVNITID